MDFSQFVASGAAAIAEGAVVERVRRDPVLALDPHILNGGLVYDPAGRARLADIHRDYARSARKAGLPILLFTDTWRCSQNLVDASRFQGLPVNQDNARLLHEVRSDFSGAPPVFIGGLVGPSGDAYKPADSLPRAVARDFHRPQIKALASSGVDFLFLATAPAVDEALGVADAMAETGLPYIISFVIRRTGVVLDGTPLGEAMEQIDAETARPPAGFSINCVHARVLETALERLEETHPGAAQRLLTFQANTGDMEVEDLDNSADLVTEAPATFVDGLERLRRRFGLRVLGGCCGTDGDHIDVLARRLACEAS
jgi:homocysteine S-methyltransferase